MDGRSPFRWSLLSPGLKTKWSVVVLGLARLLRLRQGRSERLGVDPKRRELPGEVPDHLKQPFLHGDGKTREVAVLEEREGAQDFHDRRGFPEERSNASQTFLQSKFSFFQKDGDSR